VEVARSAHVVARVDDRPLTCIIREGADFG